MASVYGDMLLYFPEQLRTFQVYDMEALVNGGWKKITDDSGAVIYTTVKGVFQNTKGAGLRESNGNLVDVDGCEFWSTSSGLQGKFLDFQDEVFRLVDSNTWSFEGGFYRYTVQKVVGNNATESDESTWNFGENSFG